MAIKIKLDNQLLIPFGSKEKWDINKIRVSSVSDSSTILSSNIPLAHIDRTAKKPLLFRDFDNIFPDELTLEIPQDKGTSNSVYEAVFSSVENYRKIAMIYAMDLLLGFMKDKCRLDTKYESLFLESYFHYVQKRCWSETAGYYGDFRYLEARGYCHNLAKALLPLPQAHLYLDDPLHKENVDWDSPSELDWPKNMMMVDFLFWDGEQMIVVEVDGKSHVSSMKEKLILAKRHIEKDRLLLRSKNIYLIHITNGEIEEFGSSIFYKLFPPCISDFCKILSAHELCIYDESNENLVVGHKANDKPDTLLPKTIQDFLFKIDCEALEVFGDAANVPWR